tara:strand:- start:1219 stop:2304 length:1086 start_codon:yes stop_codon:yes gene_type:complete
MRLEIISEDTEHQGARKTHLSRHCWELSRSPDDTTPLETILSIDAPVNEIPSFVIGVECTILEREIFASFRDHVMWARTSRVDNPSQFQAPDFFENQYKHDLAAIRDKIFFEISKGVIQDEYRMLIPLCSLTSFSTRLSWRGLIKLYKMYEHLAEMDGYFNIGLNALEEKFKLSKFAKNYSFADVLPPLEKENCISERSGPMVTIFQEMPIGLRAQVVRHRNFTIHDNLKDIINQEDFWIKTIGDPMLVSISASAEFWKTVVNKRQCWIAQYGIWSEIIQEAQMFLDIDENDLPCFDGFCPYTRDAEIRHTDDDPGAPCPIHSNLTNTPVQEKYLKSIEIEASYRPNFWKKHIEKMEVTNA